MSEPPPSRHRDAPALLLARLGLVVLALVLLWWAFDRLDHYQEEYARTFRLSVGPVVLIALVACAGGLAFGLAIAIPAALTGYRWARAGVLGILPLGLTVAYVSMFSGHFGWLPSSLVIRLSRGAEGGLFVSATLLGLSVAAGFAGRSTTPPGPPARP